MDFPGEHRSKNVLSYISSPFLYTTLTCTSRQTQKKKRRTDKSYPFPMRAGMLICMGGKMAEFPLPNNSWTFDFWPNMKFKIEGG